jgi:SAM-dependent methyltransferase
MNQSRSFDRAASYYDQTRPLPDPIAGRGVQAILDITGRTARTLEIGTGTGRIGIPLLERGLDLFGCDLSSKMLRRLHEKFPAARIAQADATLLPFPTAHFEAVLSVHVLHLIPSWRGVLSEIRRVLVPEGKYLNVTTWGSSGVSTREQLRLHWRDWLGAHGLNVRNPGMQDHVDFAQAIESQGGQLTEIEVLRYPLKYVLREELERFSGRIYSDAWDLPDELFESSIQELQTFAEREYGDLDRPLEDEVRFFIDLVTFKAQ